MTPAFKSSDDGAIIAIGCFAVLLYLVYFLAIIALLVAGTIFLVNA
jgi:hypothetical protein